ncbi:putative protein L3 [Bos taurus papillomavirus 3]|uniref:Uncharacterized protein n=1 Tax=Bovine papillomavirus type 3 TaxID=2758957 RepID=Q8BDD2_BPV3|nr:putative protein L3 [Xipapillomavirus 1]AAN09962.1 putative protein L3 [Bos taurus papillomavirus 3]
MEKLVHIICLEQDELPYLPLCTSDPPVALWSLATSRFTIDPFGYNEHRAETMAFVGIISYLSLLWTVQGVPILLFLFTETNLV